MKHTKYLLIASMLIASTTAFAATGTTTATTTTTVAAATGTTVTPAAKPAPRLVNKTATSITLEWDKSVTASGYIVMYSKNSVADPKASPDAQYEYESDQINGTGTTIEKLTAGTKYYFAVVELDKDLKQSDQLSDELAVATEGSTAVAATGATASTGAVTTTAATGASLAIVNVTPVDNKTLTVEFSAALSADPVKVKITKTADSSDVAVASVVVDPAKPTVATVTVTGTLEAPSAYVLTVLSAKDAAGKNIEAGVNGMKEFPTPANLAIAAGLNAASASGSDLSGTTLSGATGDTKVETGAKENLIVLVALVLSLGVMYVYRKRLS